MALTPAEVEQIRDKIAKNAPFQQITQGDRTLVLRDPEQARKSLDSISRKGRIRTRVMAATKGL